MAVHAEHDVARGLCADAVAAERWFAAAVEAVVTAGDALVAAGDVVTYVAEDETGQGRRSGGVNGGWVDAVGQAVDAKRWAAATLEVVASTVDALMVDGIGATVNAVAVRVRVNRGRRGRGRRLGTKGQGGVPVGEVRFELELKTWSGSWGCSRRRRSSLVGVRLFGGGQSGSSTGPLIQGGGIGGRGAGTLVHRPAEILAEGRALTYPRPSKGLK